MTAIVRASQLTKRFGSQLALDNVSFDVAPGTVFALLGENGAGKSTCIRLMLGLAGADSGTIEVLGLDSSKASLEIRRRIGYVAERPALYEWMTVQEIGWFTSGFFSDEFHSNYLRTIDRFELPRDRKIKQISKGMRAKVSLSLALASDPDLLVLDEPTSGLDTLVRREFLTSMVDRAATGKTVFLSSHQIQEVERVADHVAILRAGRLLIVERLEKLKADVVDITVTFANPDLEPPALSGELFRERRRSRQWQLFVRGMRDEDRAMLAARPDIDDIEIRSPSLEEIFVAYLRHEKSESQDPSVAVESR